MAEPCINPRAFPSAAIDDRFGGMSLRDAFAMAALTGLCSTLYGPSEIRTGILATDAYAIADAMIAQRISGQGAG